MSAGLRGAASARNMTYLAGHEPSFWLRLTLADLCTRAAAGQLEVCPHLRPGMKAAAALWAPDRLVCGTCLPTLRLTGDADRTCDRCETVADMHVCLVEASAIIVMFGLCESCRRREVGA